MWRDRRPAHATSRGEASVPPSPAESEPGAGVLERLIQGQAQPAILASGSVTAEPKDESDWPKEEP